MPSPVQPGQSGWAGNVITPQSRHRLPISCGASDGHVNSPGATGDWMETGTGRL
jgi:hypothetical protein